MRKKVLFATITTVFMITLTACGGTKEPEDKGGSNETVTASQSVEATKPETENKAEVDNADATITSSGMTNWYLGSDIICNDWDLNGDRSFKLYIQLPADTTSAPSTANSDLTVYTLDVNGIKKYINVTANVAMDKTQKDSDMEQVPYYEYGEIGEYTLEAFITRAGSGWIVVSNKSLDFAYWIKIDPAGMTEEDYEVGYTYMTDTIALIKQQIESGATTSTSVSSATAAENEPSAIDIYGAYSRNNDNNGTKIEIHNDDTVSVVFGGFDFESALTPVGDKTYTFDDGAGSVFKIVFTDNGMSVSIENLDFPDLELLKGDYSKE